MEVQTVAEKTLDGNYFGPNRPARPSNGGQVTIEGGQRPDPFGRALPAGSLGGGSVIQAPDGAVGKGIAPYNKSAPRDR
jgi:hypothetical protein